MGPDFNTWSRVMHTTLTVNNKISFIDGSILQPMEEDLFFGPWTHCNSMVISWILNSIAKEIAESLLYIETTIEVWSDLHDQFHQSNGPRFFKLSNSLLVKIRVHYM